jgi:acyl-CoA reductase-like NAD-dependent aldehyde dehydrogenase
MRDAIGAARADWSRWRDLRVAERARLLGALRRVIVRRLADIVDVVGERSAKPAAEVLANDVLPTLEIIAYCEREAERVLHGERRPGSFLFGRAEFHVEHHARGVVLVLAPFNLPFQLTLAPAVTAFAAGNAVVCKVSERVDGLASLLGELLREAGLPAGAVRFVTGGPDVGEALVCARPDLVFLTGSLATGKRVMELAAASLTPVILELGGKDPMIVFADAPFERAVNAAVYGAFANAGQICVAVKRLYVERTLFPEFAAAVAARAAALKLWPEPDAELGALATDAQVADLRAVVADAVAQGATLRTPPKVRGRVMAPTVLTELGHDARVLREETFGPVLPIVPFDDEDEAVELANATDYGLNASVWTGDVERGRRIASRIEAGSVAVNDVLKNIGNPHLPFGGVKASGIGLYHGPEGLRAFCRPLSVMVSRERAAREPNWFPYTPAKRRALESLIELRHARPTLLGRLRLFGRLRSSLRVEPEGAA